MRKITKMLVAVCMLASATFVSKAQVKYGPIVGINMANVSGDETDDNDMKLGLHLGGVVSISITDNLSIEPGAQFSMKGAQAELFDETAKLNLSYIDVPINLRYSLGEDGTGFNFALGPYVGILMSAKVSYDGDSEDVKDFYNSTDFGINLGIGYQLEGGLGFGAGYGLGLANIANDAPDDYKNTNSVIQVSVRYMLGGE